MDVEQVVGPADRAAEHVLCLRPVRAGEDDASLLAVEGKQHP
jgi:hypothetical protein